MIPKKLLAGLLISTLGLTACGGGGGDSQSAPPPSGPLAAGYILDITAATGAALANASVTIKDVNGVVVTNTTNLLGESFPNVGGMMPPLMIKVTSQDGLTSEYGYVFKDNVAPTAVNPFTSMVIAVAARQNPDTAFSGFGASVDTTVNANIETAASSLFNAFGSVLTTLGVTTTSSAMFKIFPTDHTGLDRVLDAIQVTMTGTQVLIKDKLGTTLATLDVSTGTVPALTSSAEVAESADTTTSIANYLDTVSSQCGNSTSLGSGCSALFNSSFRQGGLVNTADWLGWWNIDTSLPTATVQYRLVSLEKKDATGYWAKIESDISRSGSPMETEFDEGYFTNTSGTWNFIGDQEKLWLDVTTDTTNNRVDFTGIIKADNPATANLAYVVVTAPDNTLGGTSLKIYPYAPKYPNSSGVYQVRQCDLITGNTNTTTCAAGNIDLSSNVGTTPVAYTPGHYVLLSYQAYDASDTPIAGWSGSQWAHLQ